ncbi:MAG: DUF4296 domain-containing protein [Paludibacteraceae bacterium]|nr:DUF4296 domain-containing protein [Paludibacteraceae bacterium]
MVKILSKSLFTLMIALMACLTSCKVDKGTPLIGKEKMADIIYDFYLTEGALDLTTIPSSHKRHYYYCNLLERHGITEAEFDTALSWYSRNSEDFMEVHKLVTEKLQKAKNELSHD